jgi:NADH:ubiquinone oxidoreductase subunit F (NADH-binding)
LAEHVNRYEAVTPWLRDPHLLPKVEASGLRGRGGAGFPTGAKARSVASQRSAATVVVNGVEGEPASGKDRALVRMVPHLVFDGAVLAAAAVGARAAILCLSASAVAERRSAEAAIDERRRARIDGHVELRVVAVPDGFVSGEETAIVQFLNGGPAKPTFVPPRPFERGVKAMPTLVQNVETLAHVALIARYGPEWFRRLGTSAEPGSMLVTASGAIARPGVHEIPLGLRFVDLVDELGGLTEPAAAFLVGGYFGRWLDPNTATRLTLLDEELAHYGGSVGAGIIVAFPRTTCAVSELARVTRYLAEQSAGQCGPCVYGLRAIAAALDSIEIGHADERDRLMRWARQVDGRGACAHPTGAARFVVSALELFGHEIDVHVRYGRCDSTDRQVLRAGPRRSARR